MCCWSVDQSKSVINLEFWKRLRATERGKRPSPIFLISPKPCFCKIGPKSRWGTGISWHGRGAVLVFLCCNVLHFYHFHEYQWKFNEYVHLFSILPSFTFVLPSYCLRSALCWWCAAKTWPRLFRFLLFAFALVLVVVFGVFCSFWLWKTSHGFCLIFSLSGLTCVYRLWAFFFCPCILLTLITTVEPVTQSTPCKCHVYV